MIKSKFKKIANEVINTEINSLKKLKKSLDASFNKTIEVILNCKKGKVILSGVGKSGIIAKKISSTLASGGSAVPCANTSWILLPTPLAPLVWSPPVS